MTVQGLLEELKRRQIEVWPDGEVLRYRAPPGTFDSELKAHVRALKPAILQALTRKALQDAWEATLGRVAVRWERSSRKVWIDDSELLDAVDTGIRAADEAKARGAIESWKRAWLAALGEEAKA